MSVMLRARSVLGVAVLAVLVIVALPTRADAAKPSGGGRCPAGSQPVPKSGHCFIPVTTVISSVDANGLPADIASDGLGPYTHGAGGVVSWLTSNGYNGIAFGDWWLDTYASTSRFANHSLDPEDAVQPGDPHYTAPANPPFWGTQTLTSRLTVKCTFINRSMLTMTAGSSFTCPMINKFNVGGLDYGLSPSFSWNGGNHPEITDVQIRCNLADSGGCKDWSMTPIGLGQAVARLVPTSDTSINLGNFYLRFHIHITRP